MEYTGSIMALSKPFTPPEVLLLADHLDAILAAGEDIQKLEVDIEAVRRSDGFAAPWDRFADLIGQARLYELTIVSRVLQARTRARELAQILGRKGDIFAGLLELFASGTSVLEDATAELANRSGNDFDGGLDPLIYLGTRNVVPADAGSILGLRTLAIGENFMVARRIELGPLLDMAAALLDVLDVSYSLFDDETRQDLTDVTLPLCDVVNSQDAEPSRQAAGSLADLYELTARR